MKNNIKAALCAILLGALLAIGMTSCDNTDVPADTDAPTIAESAPVTEPEESSTGESDTETPTEEETTVWMPDVSFSALDEIMHPIFKGTPSETKPSCFLRRATLSRFCSELIPSCR